VVSIDELGIIVVTGVFDVGVMYGGLVGKVEFDDRCEG
jgi:hypothetical protein